jgi:hypothetical protein
VENGSINFGKSDTSYIKAMFFDRKDNGEESTGKYKVDPALTMCS